MSGGGDLCALVGGTPLLHLGRSVREVADVEIHAKAEWWNPGGSVKDRAALAIVRAAEREGHLRAGRRILDATSGNTGIAYAWIGAVLGYGVTLCLPANASPERKRFLRAYGAELVLTDPMSGTDGAITIAREMAAAEPDRYFYADQYSNDANWRAHFEGTGVEILEALGDRITHFVCGLGTSGTFMGTGRRLRRERPHVRLVSFQPDSPLHGLEGMKHMASAMVPSIYDPELADENREVSTERAYAMVRHLARTEGLLVGVSAGAALAASLDVARHIRRGVIVTVFPDGADRYLSERFWDEEEP